MTTPGSGNAGTPWGGSGNWGDDQVPLMPAPDSGSSDTVSGDYTYLPDGTVQLNLSDGSSMLTSAPDESGHSLMLKQISANGDVFTDFDDADPPNPHHVEFADGTSGDYTYPADGSVHLQLSDGTLTIMSGTGQDAVVLTQTTPQGDVFSQFDDLNRPHHVEFAHHG